MARLCHVYDYILILVVFIFVNNMSKEVLGLHTFDLIAG